MNITHCKSKTYGDWHAKAGAKQRSDVQSSLAGRLHRLHERKLGVRIYDYADINVLTHDVAQGLPPHPGVIGARVVYGEACRLGAKSLEQYGITFRQIPFELKVD
jgi:hypothetical protein